MDHTTRKTLKKSFTIARWGADLCYGTVILIIAFSVPAIFKEDPNLLTELFSTLLLLFAGLTLLVIGVVRVGLTSRKLYLHADHELSEEERWFTASMLELEQKGAGVQFYQSAARAAQNSAGSMASGAMSAAIIGRYFQIGKRYMSSIALWNRLFMILSLLAAIVIAILKFVL